jgi:hypothetical protein
MSQRPGARVQISENTKMTRPGFAGGGVKRARISAIWIVGLFAGVVIAIAGLLFVEVIPMSSSPTATAASQVETNKVATIVLQNRSSRCENRSFDNQTGQITTSSIHCSPDVVLNSNGVPIPTGTVRTMSSISKSFK